MSSSSLSRRQFLAGLLGTGGAALAGCQTLDRVILGDYKDEAERVVILGSGLAGLMAASHLRQNGVHFHLYEASPRLGGRVYSVPEFYRGQNVAELGAEFFSADQKMVFDLAQEFRLEVVESREIESGLRRRSGDRSVAKIELQTALRRLQRPGRPVTEEEARRQSLEAWMRGRTRESAVLEALDQWALERYGVRAGEISAEVFAPAFDRGVSPLSFWTDSRYRLRAGMGALTQALFDRTAGFQPERTYSFRHRLKAVRKGSRGMDLIFETPGGEREVFARTVICALPLAVLTEIEGLREFPGPWEDTGAFQMGAQTKFLYSYNDRFWAEKLNQGKLLQFGPGQVVWESSFRINPLFQFRQGVLSLLWGGEASRQAGPLEGQRLQKELEAFFGATTAELQEQTMMNWSRNPFIRGSVSYPRPGGNPLAWAESREGWYWAGEHTQWSKRGSLQGALESGLLAAQKVIENRPTRFFPL